MRFMICDSTCFIIFLGGGFRDFSAMLVGLSFRLDFSTNQINPHWRSYPPVAGNHAIAPVWSWNLLFGIASH